MKLRKNGMKKNLRKKNSSDKLIISKLRSKNKIQNRRIEALENRVQNLVGRINELEHMLFQYEVEEACFRMTPKHLQLDKTF